MAPLRPKNSISRPIKGVVSAHDDPAFCLFLPVVTKTSSHFSDFVTHFVTPLAPMDKGIEPMRDVVTMILDVIARCAHARA